MCEIRITDCTGCLRSSNGSSGLGSLYVDENRLNAIRSVSRQGTKPLLRIGKAHRPDEELRSSLRQTNLLFYRMTTTEKKRGKPHKCM
ncbi:hypothetical protein TcWFU_003664 [Taenia crassiceps]|uniref:Uncharacterized protein n=1 Tax=Taenia crassiceps TaxID=6207 RepID=A0ABR4QGT8_9CEST